MRLRGESAVASMEWFEDRLEQHRVAQIRHRKVQRAHRRNAQAVARVLLAVTVVVLGILAVGIGRKAVVVMQHGHPSETQRVS